ncbi:MAG: CorA family divalent cation transporter [Methanobacteriota archaeon]
MGSEILTEERKPAIKQAFCVTMPAPGKPVKIQDSNVANFLPLINGSLITWINCTVEDVNRDAEKVSVLLGFEPNLVPTLLSSHIASYEDLGSSLGLMMPAVVVNKLEIEINPLLILLRKNLVLTIHSEKVKRLVKFSRYAEIFLKKIPPELPWNDRLSIVLTRIIDEDNEKNFEGLRSIEEQGDEISKNLLDPTTPRALLGVEIYNMKHALITYLDILWASLDVINSLRHGDAEIITDNQKLLKKFGLLAGDINRHIALSEHMSEVLASGLEVLQSIYNNQLQVLNNRMAFVITWLTILGTAILVPNTLATIFGNPFSLGAGDVTWYVTLLIVATLASTWLAYFWVKKKGLIPAKIE